MNYNNKKNAQSIYLLGFIILFTTSSALNLLSQQHDNDKTLKLSVENEVINVVNSWNGKYVMLIHKENPLKSLEDFKGREIYVFYGYGLTHKNAFEFIKAIGFTTDEVKVAIQNNWEVYPKQFLENSKNIAFLEKRGAEILLKEPNVQEVKFYFDDTIKKNPDQLTGKVKGYIIGRDSKKPLGGTMIVLCEIIGKLKCKVLAKLQVIANEDGNFIISDVPPGDYTASWVHHDNLAKISFSDGLIEDFTSGGLIPITGSATTETGLSFDFIERDFNPHFTVSAGGIAQIQIKAWGK